MHLDDLHAQVALGDHELAPVGVHPASDQP